MNGYQLNTGAPMSLSNLATNMEQDPAFQNYVMQAEAERVMREEQAKQERERMEREQKRLADLANQQTQQYQMPKAMSGKDAYAMAQADPANFYKNAMDAKYGFDTAAQYTNPAEMYLEKPETFARLNPGIAQRYSSPDGQLSALVEAGRLKPDQAIQLAQLGNGNEVFNLLKRNDFDIGKVQPTISGISTRQQIEQNRSQQQQQMEDAGMKRMKAWLDIQKAQRELQPKAPDANWKEVESGGKLYLINAKTGDMKPAAIGGEQLAGKPAGQEKPMTEAQRMKFEKDLAKDYQTVNQTTATMNEIKKAIGSISTSKGLSAREGYSGYIPSVLQGKEAMTAENRINTLKGKVTQMGKAMASMAGAIGPMAVQEWKIVADAVNAIDPTAGNFSEQLANIESQADGAINRIEDKYEKQYVGKFDRYPQFKPGGPDAPPPAANLTSTQVQESLFNARKAIQRNPANRARIIEKLMANGIDPKGL